MDQLAALQQQGGVPAEGGEAGALAAMQQPQSEPSTRNPRSAIIEAFIVSELVARHRREDLAPPESLLDTPSQTQFPIMERPDEASLLSFGSPVDLGEAFQSALGEVGGLDAMGALGGGPADSLSLMAGAAAGVGAPAPPAPQGAPTPAGAPAPSGELALPDVLPPGDDLV